MKLPWLKPMLRRLSSLSAVMLISLLLSVSNSWCLSSSGYSGAGASAIAESDSPAVIPANDITVYDFSPIQFMRAFFGNYYPALEVSALALKGSDQDDRIELWDIPADDESFDSRYDGFDPRSQEYIELNTIRGQYAFKYANQWLFAEDTCLVAFENGNWDFSPYWGSSHVATAPLGWALLKWRNNRWQCAYKNLYFGDFGVWGQTRMADQMIPIASDRFAITGDEAIGATNFFTLLDGEPVHILTAYTHTEGDAYDSYSSWHTEFLTEPGPEEFYDLIMITAGEGYDSEDELVELHHYRRYRFNPETTKYVMLDSRGDFDQYPNLLEEYDGY